MKRSIKRSFLLLLLLFSLLVACSPETEAVQNLNSLLPERIDAWQRIQLITGSEALEQINTLHGKTITVEAGVIGSYQKTGNRPAMVWISRSKTPALTRQQTEIMADKMVSNPHSPFHDPTTMQINDIKVYKFLGMGQVHYIFCREKLAYWISSPPADGEKLLLTFIQTG